MFYTVSIRNLQAAIMKRIVTLHPQIISWAVLLLLPCLGFAQANLKCWYQGDIAQDSVYGISLNKAYNFLAGKKTQPVIVAVIDSGIDTTHQSLKGVLWTNAKEIPGNGIDDDGNGYVDDLHGWNFLGNKSGTDLRKDVDERSRLYYRYKGRFAGQAINSDSLNETDKWLYNQWQKAAAQMNISTDEQMEIALLDYTCKAFRKHEQVIRQELNKDIFTNGEVEKFQPATNKGKQAKLGYITCLKMFGVDQNDETNTAILTELKDYIEGKKQSLEVKKSQPEDYRKSIINDNYLDFSDRFYGNNDIMGPAPMHGTHVSGIIAGKQAEANGVVHGVAADVQLMTIRAIPDGDEYDKDVALAIRYAVDNGAKVINMSFGKGFSPEKRWVDEAVEYAASKDVLLVHAAGNESHDIDTVENFPNSQLKEYSSKAANFITVGASGDPHIGDGRLVADFSNFGVNTVDIMAPGVKIYSTLPGGNQYGFEQGTSMSAPVVTGVAALIRSYFPGLTARQVKFAIERSALHPSDSLLVVKEPGTDHLVDMASLCATAGLLNAYNAVVLAAEMKPESTHVEAALNIQKSSKKH